MNRAHEDLFFGADSVVISVMIKEGEELRFSRK